MKHATMMPPIGPSHPRKEIKAVFFAIFIFGSEKHA
jgi:hypothetical protein